MCLCGNSNSPRLLCVMQGVQDLRAGCYSMCATAFRVHIDGSSRHGSCHYSGVNQTDVTRGNSGEFGDPLVVGLPRRYPSTLPGTWGGWRCAYWVRHVLFVALLVGPPPRCSHAHKRISTTRMHGGSCTTLSECGCSWREGGGCTTAFGCCFGWAAAGCACPCLSCEGLCWGRSTLDSTPCMFRKEAVAAWGQ